MNYTEELEKIENNILILSKKINDILPSEIENFIEVGEDIEDECGGGIASIGLAGGIQEHKSEISNSNKVSNKATNKKTQKNNSKLSRRS